MVHNFRLLCGNLQSSQLAQSEAMKNGDQFNLNNSDGT